MYIAFSFHYSGLAVEPNFDDDEGGAAAGGNTQESIFNLAEPAGSGDDAESVRRTITMYRDGFTVDDGPYRRLDDPTNAPFLRALAMGRTPPELIEDAGSENVTVSLFDKRSQEYVETFRSFSGAGNALGDSTPASSGSDGVFDPAALSDSPPPVDDSQATTSIAVRLPNGQRKVVKINQRHSESWPGFRQNLWRMLRLPSRPLDSRGLKSK
jgi:UBX domain-containing protein 1